VIGALGRVWQLESGVQSPEGLPAPRPLAQRSQRIIRSQTLSFAHSDPGPSSSSSSRCPLLRRTRLEQEVGFD
jgi:hypothetical protein